MAESPPEGQTYDDGYDRGRADGWAAALDVVRAVADDEGLVDWEESNRAAGATAAVVALEQGGTTPSQPTPTAEPDCTCGSGRSAHSRDNLLCERNHAPANPPSITDMVPGTTFVARPSGSPRWLTFSRLPGADPDVEDNEGDRWRWFAIDPSTIRDVTPPKEAR